MVKKTAIIIFIMALCSPVLAADEKIDPATYICAELMASNTDGAPPIYEGLQLDGYASAKENKVVADPEILAPLLLAISDSCAAVPTDKALEHWQKARKSYPLPEDGPLRADKTTCGDYVADPDNVSGFVIWLDAYYRGKNNKEESILTSQKIFDDFMAACKANPNKLMLDVIAEYAK